MEQCPVVGEQPTLITLIIFNMPSGHIKNDVSVFRLTLATDALCSFFGHFQNLSIRHFLPLWLTNAPSWWGGHVKNKNTGHHIQHIPYKDIILISETAFL